MGKKIVAIVGSASKNSSNLVLVHQIVRKTKDRLDVTILDNLEDLPHFSPELSLDNIPGPVLRFREMIAQADGVIICTPEYVFSMPSRLKNAIEWCVSTTVFSKKPVGLITAAASGAKAHEELKLIMRTIEASFSEETTLLIQGVKGKIDIHSNITNLETEQELDRFIAAFEEFVNDHQLT